MTDHPSFDTLCDLADGVLGAEDPARRHVAACADCAGRLASLSALAAGAAALPREIATPGELWLDIRNGLAPRGAGRVPFLARARWRMAAALVLVAVGASGLTALVLRQTRDAGGAGDAGGSRTAVVAPVPPAAPGSLPAHLASAEYGYLQRAATLRRALDQRRDSLAPSTVEIVERSLRVADSAIAEARAALAQDPANGALAEIFGSNYERKLDLLRRASELEKRT